LKRRAKKASPRHLGIDAMYELKKTIAFAVVALLLMGAALLGTPSRVGTGAFFNDQGQPFFASFKDPLACTSLEVIDVDTTTAMPLPFKVMFKNNKWVVPSHHDYPADAKDRLAKTASSVIDLKKDTIRSDRVEDQEDLGVIDPLDTKSSSLKGRGKRVTLRNKSDEVLADFIIGKEVPGRPDQRFVRVPDQKRIYGVNVKVDLSTRFSDWIETNLLKLDSFRLRKVVFDPYKVFPEEDRIQPGEVVSVERKDSATNWTLPGLKADEEVSADKMTALASALADLKIVGVRVKPPGLTQDLKARTDGKIRLDNSAILSLQSRGFYLTRDGRLLSNQGDLRLATDEGVAYTLRFGEVVFATGDALTAGTDDSKSEPGKAKKDEAKSKSEAGAESRYLFVTVEFDSSLIPEPPPEPKPELPDDAFQRDPDDPKRVAAEQEAKGKADRAAADHERKLKEGRDRAKELTERFASWYYVIPGDSFRAIMLDRAALIQKKGAKPTSPPGGLPLDGSNFPPGFPPQR
jgi:hypothetical protein